jgi:hypothetical protein
MSGAPELAPEQLGKAVEFQKHVKVYNAYAIKAVSKGEPHLSLARTMAKHSFAIATALTAQVIKRYRLAPHTFSPGDILHYTPQMVMDMPDDLFIRLYTESCSIAIEDPSQARVAPRVTMGQLNGQRGTSVPMGLCLVINCSPVQNVVECGGTVWG